MLPSTNGANEKVGHFGLTRAYSVVELDQKHPGVAACSTVDKSCNRDDKLLFIFCDHGSDVERTFTKFKKVKFIPFLVALPLNPPPSRRQAGSRPNRTFVCDTGSRDEDKMYAAGSATISGKNIQTSLPIPLPTIRAKIKK